MSAKKACARHRVKSKRVLFKTTIFDLISGLIDRVPNDAAIVAQAQRIFADYDVRLLRTLTPLRLGAASGSPQAQAKRATAKTQLKWV
jgi:hypothetical protein